MSDWIRKELADLAPEVDVDAAFRRVDRRHRRRRTTAVAGSAALVTAATLSAVWAATRSDSATLRTDDTAVVAETVSETSPAPSPTDPAAPVVRTAPATTVPTTSSPPTAERWESIDGAPLAGRQDFRVVASPDAVFVIGGQRLYGDPDVGRPFADGAQLDVETGVWTPLPPSPLNFVERSAVWTGTELAVMGRSAEDLNRSLVALFEPTIQQWRTFTLPTNGADIGVSMAPIDGKLFVYGNPNRRPDRLAFTIDLSNGDIIELDPGPLDRTLDQPKLVTLGDRVLVSIHGVTDGRSHLATVDPVTGTWSDARTTRAVAGLVPLDRDTVLMIEEQHVRDGPWRVSHVTADPLTLDGFAQLRPGDRYWTSYSLASGQLIEAGGATDGGERGWGYVTAIDLATGATTELPPLTLGRSASCAAVGDQVICVDAEQGTAARLTISAAQSG